VGEEELRGVDTKPLVGHLAAWNYFMSIKSPANTEFVKKWSDYAKAKGIAGHKDKPLTNDPMEATYIGIMMWAQAVTKAKSTDTDKVIAAMAGQTFKAPGGFTHHGPEEPPPAQAGVHRRGARPTASSTWCGRPRARSWPTPGATTSPRTRARSQRARDGQEVKPH
jgi:hypothetical protein